MFPQRKKTFYPQKLQTSHNLRRARMPFLTTPKIVKHGCNDNFYNAVSCAENVTVNNFATSNIACSM